MMQRTKLLVKLRIVLAIALLFRICIFNNLLGQQNSITFLLQSLRYTTGCCQLSKRDRFYE